MDLRPLRALVEVVRQGGFSQAAKTIYATQPTVSKAVRQLEDELGLPLLDRQAQPVRLTEAGEIVYRRAVAMLAERDDLYAELDDLKGLKRGILRLGLPPLGSSSLFAPMFARFRSRYPQIEISLVEHGSRRLEEMVMAGEIELAASLQPVPDNVEWQPVAREPLMALLPADHPFAHAESVGLADLRESPFILFETGFALNRILHDACQRAGIRYYPKWLGAIPFSPVTGARLLGDAQAAAQLLAALPETLHQQGLSSAHINFTDAPGDALLRQQPEWLMRLGCQYHWHNRGYRDFQDFLDTLMSRKRKQLRKERERVAQSGFEFTWYRGDELREEQWDFVYTCYANTYAVRGQRPYLTRSFFSLLAARMPHSIRVAIAHLQQQPAAMASCLVDGETLYGRYWGCLAEFDRLQFETCF